MKQVCLLCALLLSLTAGSVAQENKYSTFYHQRASLFEELPVTSDDIIFLGNSISNGCEWGELFQNPHAKNRGISGDVALGVYDRLEAITKGKPAKIFLLIGVNDLSGGRSTDSIVYRTGLIIAKIKKESPTTKVYLQSMLPLTDHFGLFSGHTSRWKEVPIVNEGFKQLAEKEQVTYVDLYSHFIDQSTGKMNILYTNDGLHLLGKGYLLWRDIVQPYVNE